MQHYICPSRERDLYRLCYKVTKRVPIVVENQSLMIDHYSAAVRDQHCIKYELNKWNESPTYYGLFCFDSFDHAKKFTDSLSCFASIWLAYAYIGRGSENFFEVHEVHSGILSDSRRYALPGTIRYDNVYLIGEVYKN